MVRRQAPVPLVDSYHTAVTKMVSGGLRIVHSDLLRCDQLWMRIHKTVAQLSGLEGFPAPEPHNAEYTDAASRP